MVIYPLTTDIAKLAGKLDAEQQNRGIVIPFAGFLVGATRSRRDELAARYFF